MIDLQKLKQDGQRAVEAVIERVKLQPDHAVYREAINWGDLGCCSAHMDIDDEGCCLLRIVVEEASPEAGHLRQEIAKELLRLSWPEVEVITEW